MTGYEFERATVRLIDQVANAKGIKAKPLAEKAWPGCDDAGTKWRKIRNGNKLRGLLLRDAFDLSCALNVNMTDLCGMIMMESGLIPDKF